MDPGREGRRPSGTVTFLFTDVEGSTRLWAADRRAMSASLEVHDAIIRSAIEAASGYVFSTAGDSFAAAFRRASDGVAAASAAQADLAAADWPGPELRVRMGLHLGEAEERGDDYFGPAVNTAARVASAGHGGQILLTDQVRVTAAITPRDLGVHQLRDVAEPMRLYQLGEGAFPELRVVDARSSNLPVRPTRLLGRDRELSHVRQLLTANRLVTLTAIGGSGKTRLAIAVGEEELPARPNGVWFVDLRTVTADDDVPKAVAKSVGLTLRDGDLAQQAIDYFADKSSLIILDNCEHVVEGCALFAERFLTTPGQSCVLATSREALDVEGERTVVVGSLDASGPDAPAVQLFSDRAVAVDPSFVIGDATASTVMSLCQHLDGLPLAIELAAARVSVMTPSDLLVGLHQRFELLSGGRRRQRHRTLEATLDWSYELLSTEEQRVMRALGVFVDGFDLGAVAAVARISHSEAMTIVEALVAKSLVVRADRGDRARFSLLETVKAYAEGRLRDAGEDHEIRARHLSHFHSVATPAGRTGMSDIRLGGALRPDRSNLTAAFEWGVANDRWIEAGELIGGSYSAYLLDGGTLEARTLIERALPQCAALDAELGDYLRLALLLSVAWINDWATFERGSAELATSPVRYLRAFGLAAHAYVTSFSDVEGAYAELSSAQAEIDAARAMGADLRTEIAAGVIPWIRGRIAGHHGDFEAALRGTQEFLESQKAADYFITASSRAAKHAAACQVLLGEPEAALRTVEWLESFDPSTFNGDEIRALAHLALGALTEAEVVIRRYAARALTGRMPGETCDSALLLAALAHAGREDDVARDLLLNMGMCLEPGTVIYSGHLAAQLGMALEHGDRQQLTLTYDDASPEGPSGMRMAAAAVRKELARRRWD